MCYFQFVFKTHHHFRSYRTFPFAYSLWSIVSSPDGHTPLPGQRPRCGSLGMRLYGLYKCYLDYKRPLVNSNALIYYLVLAPDSAFYNWVEGSLVQRVHFSVPSQECVAGVGMQLPLSVKHEYHYRARQMASNRNLGNR